MKKSILTAAVAIALLAACKKDRTCTCTDSIVSRTSTEPGYTYNAVPPSTSKTTYKEIKKNNIYAQLCKSSENTDTYTYTSWNGTTTAQYQMTTVSKSDCELD